MMWDYKKVGDDEIRTCPKCKLSQIKSIDGDWCVYLTIERINQFYINLLNDVKEDCPHQNWIDD